MRKYQIATFLEAEILEFFEQHLINSDPKFYRLSRSALLRATFCAVAHCHIAAKKLSVSPEIAQECERAYQLLLEKTLSD